MMNFDFSTVNWSDVSSATGETLQMMLFSVLFTFLVGLPLGVLLYLTGRTDSTVGKIVYSILSFIVNVLRSVPFVILMIAIIPITRIVVGTSIGVEGTIPPLVIAAAPFFARLVETSLREVDRGVIEAAQAMGASTWQIVYKVLLPEAMPGLIAGTTITAVTLVSYTAMSGLIGGGGLGDLAIRYGYHRYEIEMMIVAIVIMVILVQVLQWIGDAFVRRYTRK
ncbi:methionine ABC transporter permease [Paenibacillus sp. chi10]|uniref:Methionine ABC transporter permease n=1 Tax=Paenibacillus suaedae TaxID=3077233 RepID=A0AAJ2NB94_9BACL|nr:methionine ABC transporter permease [Paenibacillus sp. chi10]MDT8979559.1 methionine ABC transporter permease [Paenibacillus sp. chi10]